MKILFCFLGLALVLNGEAFGAENQKPPQFLTVNPVKTLVLKQGKTGEAKVSVTVDKIFHIQSNPASQPNLIPTTLAIEAAEGLVPGVVEYPAGKNFRLENSDKDLSVYEGTVDLKILVTAKSAKVGKYELKGFLKFQPCNEKICFFPNKREVTIPVQVLK